MAEPQTSAPQPGSSAKTKRFMLVVDSNPRDANFVSMLLQNFGYNSTVVKSCEEALEMMSIAVPAVIVTELILPGANGFDFYDKIRKDPELAQTPVIIQTRFPDMETEDRCRRIGCAGCLNKPVQSEELYRAIQGVIEPTPRMNIRIPTFLKASVDGVGSGTEFVTVLSDSGLFVKTLEPRARGTKHTITFLLDRKIIRVDAMVLYVYSFGEGPNKEPGMGMKFLNLENKDRDVIQEYIRAHVSPPILPDLIP